MSKEQVVSKTMLEKYISNQIADLFRRMSCVNANIVPLYQGQIISLKRFAVDHDLNCKIELRLEQIFPEIVKEKEKESLQQEASSSIFIIGTHEPDNMP